MRIHKKLNFPCYFLSLDSFIYVTKQIPILVLKQNILSGARKNASKCARKMRFHTFYTFKRVLKHFFQKLKKF